MKHFKLLFVVMLLSFSVHASAGIINETDHFFCGFDTEDEYNLWTKVNSNGVDEYGFNDWWWDSSGGAYYHPFMTEGDDWIISPAVTLSGEKKMAVKVKMWLDPYNIQDRLQFTVGNEANVDSQTTILLDEIYSAGNYYVSIPLPEDMAAGTYYFGIHAMAPGWGGPDLIQSFEVVENSNCALGISITDQETKGLIANANVSLSGNFYETIEKTTTDEGRCEFVNLSPGVYKLNVKVDGYIPVTDYEVVINNGESTLTKTFEMESVLYSVVSGKVVDGSGNPEKGATVTLDGEDIDYEVITDENGNYVIEEVRRPRKYQMSVSKDFKISYRETLNINDEDETKELGDIVLEDFVAAPVSLKAEPTGRGMFVSWMMPMENREFSKDNGKYEGMYTIENSVYATMGVLFREPMRVTSVSWMALDVADELVDVYVYILDSDGSMPSKPAYEAKGVPTKNYNNEEDFVWPEHVLPQTIDAPYGCIVAIGHARSLSIALDYLNNSSTSLTTGLPYDGWDVCRLSNFFIRAKGNPLCANVTFADDTDGQAMNIRCRKPDMQNAEEQNSHQANFGYNIWRFEQDSQEMPDSWICIASNVRSMYYIDPDFSLLEQGVYKYAIQTAYSDGSTSEIAFSGNIDHRMLTSLTVDVFTNTAIDYSEGTEIKAVNKDDESLVYTATVTDNKATLENLWKGTYLITAYRQGFKPYTIELVLTDRDIYNEYIDLELEPSVPFNLTASQADESTDVVLEWNGDDGISEDCETMEDFAVNPTGRYDWTYADVDGADTYGVKQCEATPYPNMFAPMAYMAFNPSATTPGLLEYLQPHGGEKMLVSVSLQDIGKSNDDYLFSPALSFDSDFILEFYAASGFYASLGNEEFMVGYTVGDAIPENVVWITDKPQTVGAVWTKFVYNMPKEACHIVIRCVSNQHMFFMLDDIFIGRRETETFAMTTFNVYLDDEFIGNTTERSMAFNNLTPGKHLAKVQTVYPMRDNDKAYSDFEEHMFTVKAISGIDTPVADMLYSYKNGVIVPGEKVDRIDLYDMQGRLCATCSAGGVIGTDGFGTGVYLIRISHDCETSISKILVE